MNKKKIIVIAASTIALLMFALAYFLFRPLSEYPRPAKLACVNPDNGQWIAMPPVIDVYAVGLSYSKHIEETASDYSPDQKMVIFKKDLRSITSRDVTRMPDSKQLIQAADDFEPGLGNELRMEFKTLAPLLDYEVEIGFILLRDLDSAELSNLSELPLAFFVTNDISARSLAVLGEGRSNRTDYWGMSKSFPGFLPLPKKAYRPQSVYPNSFPCVWLQTTVNRDLRQSEKSTDLIYTPLEILQSVASKNNLTELKRGTMFLSGTPGGVIMTTPRYKARLASWLGLDRFMKLDVVLGKKDSYLKPGDKVTVSGEWLGSVDSIITTSGQPDKPGL